MELIEAREEFAEKAKSLFSGWNETLIASCLQGVMGQAYVAGDAAAAYLGDLSFYAGSPSEELLRFKPNPESKFVIMVPGSEAWEPLLEEMRRFLPEIFGDI